MEELDIQNIIELGIRHIQAGQLPEAEAALRRVLAVFPGHPHALQLLGLLAHRTGQYSHAAELIRRAIVVQPTDPVYHYNLGVVLRDAGLADEAAAAFQEALKYRPDFAEAMVDLGLVLRSKGCLDQAVAVLRAAVRCAPAMASAHNNLGIALHDVRQFAEAVEAFRNAIRLRPDYTGAFCNMGLSLRELRRMDEAIAATRAAIRIDPGFALAHNNLGDTLKESGDIAQAIVSYRRATELAPDNPAMHSNLVYARLFDPGASATSIREECGCWNQRHAEPLKKLVRPHVPSPNAGRRLRIGYVSPDLRDHVIGRNLAPLFEHSDRGRFEIFCYADVRRPDWLTHRLRRDAEHWRSIIGLTDQQVAELIRGDGIDILVDLSLHLAHNRLLVFARKPAPLQVTFAGYPGTTGLEAMDFRLTDPHLDPPESSDAAYSEKSIRLANSFWCYDPLGSEIAVGKLPARSRGFITFGCLNNFCKINDYVLELWAEVLRAVSGSRLVMLTDPGSHRERTLASLERLGVDRARVEFACKRPRQQYLELYHGVDIALDTVPYNGHTTSLDAFWMGVPVVTLVGQTVVGRAGLSQCMNLGLTELVAWSREEFVPTAARLAGDLPRLAEMRSALRQRMERSPLMDGEGFARGVETAYRCIAESR